MKDIPEGYIFFSPTIRQVSNMLACYAGLCTYASVSPLPREFSLN